MVEVGTERVLLVDGYNIINSWPELISLKEKSLGAARDKLCDLLQEYIPYPWAYIIVVFDAYQIPRGKPTWDNYGKVQVAYSGEGQTADTFIENTTSDFVGKIIVEVATSDWGEQRSVFGHGAIRLSAREFAERLKEEKESIRSIITEKNNKGPRRSIDEVLSPELRDRLETMRRKK